MIGILAAKPEDLQVPADRPVQDVVFLCTGQRVLDACREKGLNAFFLDEELLRGRYDAINRWSFQAVVSLVDACASAPEKAFFLESNFYMARSVLIQILKTALLLEVLFAKHRFTELRIARKRPDLLADVCRVYLREKGFDVRVCDRSAEEAALSQPAGGGKFWLKRGIERVLSVCNSARNRWMLDRARRAGDKVVLASGSLHHLGGLLDALKNQKNTCIAFCESDFNFEKFLFCLRHGMAFWTIRRQTARGWRFEAGDFAGAADLQCEGWDVERLFREVLAAALNGPDLHLSFDPVEIRGRIQKHHVNAVVLDEDFAGRRVFSILARDLGVPCFVTLHGVPIHPIFTSQEGFPTRRFYIADTIANSGFEKDACEKVYYEGDQISVLGVPRYDAISGIKKAQTARPAKSAKPKQILFLTPMMEDWSYDFLIPLIGYKDLLGDYGRLYVNDLLQAVDGRSDLRLKIKPHYRDEWVIRNILKRQPGRFRNCELLSHRSDTFALEAEADVIVTVESTVICEGVIYEKPVIVMNYPPQDLTMPYEAFGVIQQVKGVSELKQAIECSLYDEEYLRALDARRKQCFEYFSGPLDGRNTERSAAHIRSRIGRKDRHAVPARA